MNIGKSTDIVQWMDETEIARERESRSMRCSARPEQIRLWKFVYCLFSIQLNCWLWCCVPCHMSHRERHTHTECICMGMVFIVRLWLFIWANCVRVKCQSPMFIHVYMLSMRQWHGMCWYLASAKQPQNTHNFTFNSISPTHFVSTYIQQLAGMY